ncbi:MAG: hypothetical protein RL594_266 [Bacteroidota bacterium]
MAVFLWKQTQCQPLVVNFFIFTMLFRHHVHLDEVESTNDVAREFLRDHEAIVVSTNHQTRGRGRCGRQWQDAYGQNVLVSFGIRHTQEHGLREAAADMARGTLAVFDVLGEYLPRSIYRCKYPNDVQAYDTNRWCKIAGVLVEHEWIGGRCDASIIGIGINILQTDFPETITQPCTSLRRLGKDVLPTTLLKALIPSLELTVQMDANQIFRLWSSALEIGNTHVTVNGSGDTWRAIRLEDDGRLILENLNDGTRRTIDDGDSIRYID